MRLDDCVMSYGDDVVLYIGAMSGYMFIGTKEAYEVVIDNISKDLKKKAKDLLKTRKRELQRHFLIDDRDEQWQAQKTWLESRIKYLEEFLSDFKSLREREVKAEYKRETGGRAIVIEGTECGRYWDEKERGAKNEYKIG